MSLLAVKRGMIGGLATYVRQIARALATRDPSRFVFFSSEELADEWRTYLPKNAVVHAVHVGNDSATRRAVFEIKELPRYASSLDCDVLFYPNTSAPIRSTPKPVVMLFDVMYRSQPHDTPLHKRLYLDLCCWRLRKSRIAVITLSDFSRRDIHHRTGIPLERITAVPCGVDEAFLDVSPNPPLNQESSRGYLLSVGAAYPHKRLPVLLDAFDRIASESPQLELLMVGTSHGGEAEQAKVHARAKASRFSTRIRFLPALPWDQLPHVYAGAAALVHASQFEGFGLPIAEAMAVGIPVAAAPAPGVIEILGNNGEIAAGWRPEDLAVAIERVLAWTPEDRLARTASGRGRVLTKYRWSRAAEELDAQFHATVGSTAHD